MARPDRPPRFPEAGTGSTARIRADELATTAHLLRFAAGRPAIGVVVGAAAAVLGARMVVGASASGAAVTVVDGVVALVLVALAGPIEWAVHRYLFHAPANSARHRRLGTGVGHRRHHRDPTDLRWLLLEPGGMAGFALVFAVVAVAVASVVVAVAGGRALGPSLTGVAVSWLLLARYEIVHLAHHSRRRPWTARGRRIRAHHLAHHHRHPHGLLGVTSRLPDRLFRTAPSP